jgi:hypothetical protein
MIENPDDNPPTGSIPEEGTPPEEGPPTGMLPGRDE